VTLAQMTLMLLYVYYRLSNNCLVLLVYALFYINLYIFVLLCTILMLNKK